MEEGNKNIKKRPIILSALAACLFLLLAGWCCRYALQKQVLQEKVVELQGEVVELQGEVEELATTLADRDKTIETDRKEMEDLRTLLAEAEQSLQREVKQTLYEYETETGFVKKNGVYLIDDKYQLRTLSQLVSQNAEIEPGVAAAEASYRLREDLVADDWITIGTKEVPFCGRFDGDGNSIRGYFPLSAEGEDVAETFFQTDSAAWIVNLEVGNYMNQSSGIKITQWVENQEECSELAEKLARFPNCRIRLTVYDGDYDTRKIVDELQKRWERNQEQDGFSVSVNFNSNERPQEETEIQNAMEPFSALAGTEFAEIIEEALTEEEGYLMLIKLERIGELNCCTFEIGELEDRFRSPREDASYHIILEGKWEGKEVPQQHFHIPYTSNERHSLAAMEISEYNYYLVENVDVDFDGKQDLLIHEGFSNSSNYRAIVWREEEGKFEYYPSFPENAEWLEFDQQRVINRGHVGGCYEYIEEYGVVNGEYTCTRELVTEEVYDKEKDGLVIMLHYYEMGELVRTHILSDLSDDWREREKERAELYPDMDYWRKG